MHALVRGGGEESMAQHTHTHTHTHTLLCVHSTLILEEYNFADAKRRAIDSQKSVPQEEDVASPEPRLHAPYKKKKIKKCRLCRTPAPCSLHLCVCVCVCVFAALSSSAGGLKLLL